MVPNVSDPIGYHSLSGCQAMCSSTAQCTAIVMHSAEKGHGQCFLRKNVVESSCVQGSPYDTYLQASPHPVPNAPLEMPSFPDINWDDSIKSYEWCDCGSGRHDVQIWTEDREIVSGELRTRSHVLASDSMFW